MDQAVQQRHYQAAAVDGAFARWAAGDDSTLVVLPTGTGKTIVAGQVARRARDDHGRRTLFLAHREELIRQAADKIGHVGLTTAVEMAAEDARRGAALFGKPDVVVGTVQTLQGRRLASWPKDEFGLIITDEAHHARAESYGRIYDHFAGAWHLGITATPDRGDGRNLGTVYQSIAHEYSLRDAIGEGFLVPLTTARLVTDVSLKSIKTTGGDYNLGDLAERIAPHVEKLADAIVKECGDRPTVVFTPDVGSAKAMAFALSNHGERAVPAVAVDGEMPKPLRADALEQFDRGRYQALVCCDLLIEGWDCPKVACVVVCRPTKKRSRYAQMIGRGTRIAPGKVDCLVIDFAWQTTAQHELVKATELFDDSQTDDSAIELAGDVLDAGLTADPMQAVAIAEAILSTIAQARARSDVALTPADAIQAIARRREAGLDEGRLIADAVADAVDELVEAALEERRRKAQERAERLARGERPTSIPLAGHEASYRKIVYDPVGVAGVVGMPLKSGWDFDPARPATEKQRALLARLGMDQAAGLSRIGASKSIDFLLDRLKKGLATPKQVGTLQSLGVPPDEARAMPFKDASETIGRLLGEARARRPRRSA